MSLLLSPRLILRSTAVTIWSELTRAATDPLLAGPTQDCCQHHGQHCTRSPISIAKDVSKVSGKGPIKGFILLHIPQPILHSTAVPTADTMAPGRHCPSTKNGSEHSASVLAQRCSHYCTKSRSQENQAPHLVCQSVDNPASSMLRAGRTQQATWQTLRKSFCTSIDTSWQRIVAFGFSRHSCYGFPAIFPLRRPRQSHEFQRQGKARSPVDVSNA